MALQCVNFKNTAYFLFLLNYLTIEIRKIGLLKCKGLFFASHFIFIRLIIFHICVVSVFLYYFLTLLLCVVLFFSFVSLLQKIPLRPLIEHTNVLNNEIIQICTHPYPLATTGQEMSGKRILGALLLC